MASELPASLHAVWAVLELAANAPIGCEIDRDRSHDLPYAGSARMLPLRNKRQIKGRSRIDLSASTGPASRLRQSRPRSSGRLRQRYGSAKIPPGPHHARTPTEPGAALRPQGTSAQRQFQESLQLQPPQGKHGRDAVRSQPLRKPIRPLPESRKDSTITRSRRAAASPPCHGTGIAGRPLRSLSPGIGAAPCERAWGRSTSRRHRPV